MTLSGPRRYLQIFAEVFVRESLFLLAGLEANSILSHEIGSFKLTKRKTTSKYVTVISHDYIKCVPKSIIPEAL